MIFRNRWSEEDVRALIREELKSPAVRAEFAQFVRGVLGAAPDKLPLVRKRWWQWGRS